MDSLHKISEELGKAFYPLSNIVLAEDLEDAVDEFSALIRELGWSVEEVPAPILQLLEPLKTLLDNLRDVSNPNEKSEENYLELIVSVFNLIASIEKFPTQSFPNSFPQDFVANISKRLVDYLIITYAQFNYPSINYLFKFFGIVKPLNEQLSLVSPKIVYSIDYEKIPLLLSDPITLIKNEYLWGTNKFNNLLLIRRLLDLFLSFKIKTYYHQPI